MESLCPIFLAVFFSACGTTPAPAAQAALSEIKLSDEQALEIGKKLWMNEGGGKVEALTSWNDTEAFASVGINHFIWYPKNHKGRFVETFPSLLAFLVENGVALPDWLKGAPPCPWNDRESFQRDLDSPLMREFRQFLIDTIPWQARWAANRLEKALPLMLAATPKKNRAEISAQFYRVAASSNGVYALVDYLNFKGEGISRKERYNGFGWGLLQVLEGMSGKETGSPAREEFAHSAEIVLTRRAENAPPPPPAHPEFSEKIRWLPGWLKRIQTYRTS